jgi:histidine kinase
VSRLAFVYRRDMRATLSRQLGSIPPFVADAALACALAVVAELEVLASASFPGSDGAAAAAIPVIALPLAWRRRAPVVTVAAVYAAYAAQTLAGGHAEQSVAVAIALLVAIYSIAAHAVEGRVALAGLVAGQAVAWMALALEGGRGIGDYVFSLLLGGGAWLGGYAVRSGRTVAERLERRAERAEAMSAAERERAVTEERARIAREMHDVVAHTMSVVVVQTGAARQVLRSEPERTEQMLYSVEATSRQALAEMRRLLGWFAPMPRASASHRSPGSPSSTSSWRGRARRGSSSAWSARAIRARFPPESIWPPTESPRRRSRTRSSTGPARRASRCALEPGRSRSICATRPPSSPMTAAAPDTA